MAQELVPDIPGKYKMVPLSPADLLFHVKF